MNSKLHKIIETVAGLICGTSFVLCVALMFGPLTGDSFTIDHAGNANPTPVMKAYQSSWGMLKVAGCCFILSSGVLWWLNSNPPRNKG